MNMVRPTHIFFDLGDTLVDLRPLAPAMANTIRLRIPELEKFADEIGWAWVASTAEETPKAQGVDYRPGLVIAARALQQAVMKLDVEIGASASLDCVREAWREYLEQAELHEDASLEVLRTLRDMVESMSIVTDSDTSMVEPLLRRLQIEELFDTIVVSDSVGAYKPDPRIFLAAMARVKGRPERSVFVSDSIVDLEGASSVGMRAVWINRKGTRPRNDVQGMRTIRGIHDLPPLLRGWGGRKLER